MAEIKSWAFSVCIILITSGIFMRILPERSDKRNVRFIVTLILITAVFNIDISSFENAFDIGSAGEISESEYENSLLDEISSSLCDEIEKIALGEYQDIDPSGDIKVKLEDGKIVVCIASSESLTTEKLENFKSRLETRLGEKIEISYEE